jgi:hypothetical protein
MMRSLAVPLACVLVVQGQPISKQSGAGIRMPQRFTPQQHFASAHYQPAIPFTVQAPQERIQLDYRNSHDAIRTKLQAEAEGASEPEYVNIYEEPLVKCIEDDYCPYRSAEVASHDICATIRLKMSVEAIGMAWGADGATNDPECENILAYGASTDKRRQESRGYAMIPQCSALPAGVLDSKFSVDMMTGETLKQKVVKPNYDLKSSAFFQDGRLVEQKGALFLGGTKTQFTRATNNFRKAIASICELCAAEAPNEKAKENLVTACAKITALDTSDAEQETGAISAFATALVGAFIAGGATFALLRFRSGARVAAEEPFLKA